VGAPGDATVRLAIRQLGQEVDPVEVVALAEARDVYGQVPGAGAPTPGMNAFRVRQGASVSHIYVNRDSTVYRAAARRPTPLALLRLAATLLHEQVHRTDGDTAAYRLQADFVRSRMRGIPWRERSAAERYLRDLEQRAQAQHLAESRRRAGPPGRPVCRNP
jgi:hypothetical protein